MRTLFRPAVVSVMVACVAVSLVGLAHLFAPTWNGTYLVAACVLAALEASYSYQLVQEPGLQIVRFRLIELATLLVLVKISSYIGDSWIDILADVRTWPGQPLNVFSLETIGAFMMTLISWEVATATARNLDQLASPPDRYSRQDSAYVPPLQRLTNRFFMGGLFLLVLAGITRVGIAELLDLNRPSVPGLVINVLIYFLLGLVVLGQARFVELRRQWQVNEIKIGSDVSGRWVRYSLIFIGLTALLAFLLPTDYTIGLLELANTGLSAITFALMILQQLLLLILSLPLFALAYLIALLTGNPPPDRSGRLPQIIPPTSAARPVGPTASWLEILRSVLFWAILFGMIFYTVRNYLRNHPELLASLARFRLIQVLGSLLSFVRRWLGGIARVARRIPEQLSERLMRRRPQGESGAFRFFRLGALPPRERIRYYYLSILKRTGQRGFLRRHMQTPYEYDATLSPNLPEAREEMSALTEAFVEANYSQHALDEETARRVRDDWRKVKGAARALGRDPRSTETGEK